MLYKKIIPCIILQALCLYPLKDAGASAVGLGFGLEAGFLPSIMEQEQSLLTLKGTDHKGLSLGAGMQLTIVDYVMFKLGVNYVRSIYGGDYEYRADIDAESYIDLSYSSSLWMIDVPLTFGLNIPFWQDVRVSFTCGTSFAYGRNDIKASEEIKTGDTTLKVSPKYTFSGYAFPIVFLLQGEYMISKTFSVSSSISYREGTSDIKRQTDTIDGEKYPSWGYIDFTGYRWNLGLVFYVDFDAKKREEIIDLEKLDIQQIEKIRNEM